MPREERPNHRAAEIGWGVARAIREELPNGFREGGDWGEARGDSAIAALAARQHGVVTTAQLAAAGIRRDAVTRRVVAGWLTRLHRGVYQMGPVPAPLGREMAAVLACGPAALISHQSAAALWGFRPAWHGPVHVTVAGRDPRRPGIRTHRTIDLPPSMRAVHQRLPLTSPARTLDDLAPLLHQRDLDRAAEQAQILRLTTRADLLQGRSPALRRALHHDPALTRSEAEVRLLDLIRAARLPTPRANARVLGYEVDLLWPSHRLIVEVDGYAFHSTREAFERDRLRDANLQAHGYRIVRVTWQQITREPEALVARLAVLLA